MGIRVLLDTHVLLWALASPARLSDRVRSLLEDPDTSVLVSAGSAWEIATKYRLGKLPGAGVIVTDYAGCVKRRLKLHHRVTANMHHGVKANLHHGGRRSRAWLAPVVAGAEGLHAQPCLLPAPLGAA